MVLLERTIDVIFISICKYLIGSWDLIKSLIILENIMGIFHPF